MKREKISLFILVAEIVVISLLHTAKNTQPKVQNQQLTKDNAVSATYHITPALQLTKLR
jgi:hypothetical protein